VWPRVAAEIRGANDITHLSEPGCHDPPPGPHNSVRRPARSTTQTKGVVHLSRMRPHTA
jgi:hypothetical protein